jgi:hypothetical protein
MFHRILETFFLVQVMIEGVVDSALNLKEEVLHSVCPKSVERENSTEFQEPKARQRYYYESTHTLEDLPPKFYCVFKQCTRYLFVSLLGAMLDRSR